MRSGGGENENASQEGRNGQCTLSADMLELDEETTQHSSWYT